jgi:RNA polymerase sigma factor (sigma-70 family)
MRHDLPIQHTNHQPPGVALPGDSFKLYAPGLRAYCLRLLADPSLADDAVQQTFEIAVESYSSLRDPGRLKGWMFRIARNECLRLLAQPRALPLTEDHPADLSQSPAEMTTVSDFHQSIDRALDSLPPIYRQAVVLRDMEGFSYLEIATLTGVSLASVKFRIYKGRDLLMNALGSVLKEWRMP